MKARVLIIAAPFGFGPAAKALILAQGLLPDVEVDFASDREAWAFINRHKPAASACTRGTFAESFPDRASLAAYDHVISVNQVPALEHLAGLGLAGRTVFVDSLRDWRQASGQAAPPDGLRAYLVQDYPGAADPPGTVAATPVQVTAPLLWPLPPRDAAAPRQGVLLHLGGVTSPLAPWRDMAGPVTSLVMQLAQAVAVHGRSLTVLGSAHLRDIGPLPAHVEVLGDVSPEQSTRAIGDAELLLSTPGVGALFEAMRADTPVVLLPPLNSTQIHHHTVLAGLGLASALPPALADRLAALSGPLDWQGQTRLCQDLLRQPPGVLLAALPPLLQARLGGADPGAPPDPAWQAQRRIFAGLSRTPPLDLVRALVLEPAAPSRPSLPVLPASRGDAAAADDTALRALLLALPKVELHLHLEGSIPPALMLALARRNGLQLPFEHPLQFRQAGRYPSFRAFADRLLMGVHCLRQAQDFHDAVAALGAGLARQNVRYAEVTWTPQLYLNRQPTLDEILAAMNRARAQVLAQWGVELRWIPDLVRSVPGAAAAIVAWACRPEIRAAGVVAIGLGGPEAGHPAPPFAAHFQTARAAGLPANPHAGEGLGPDSVWQTLESLRPSRIGHGVRSIEDPALVDHLARHAVPLEVCLSSNVQLGLYPSLADHPLRRLLDAGCRISLNTDDPVLFGTTLSDEYRLALQHCGLSLQELCRCILGGLQSSYLDDAGKARLTAEFELQFRRLQQQDGPPPAG